MSKIHIDQILDFIQDKYDIIAKEFTMYCYPYGGFIQKGGSACGFTSKLISYVFRDSMEIKIPAEKIDCFLDRGWFVNIELIPHSGFDGPPAHSVTCIKNDHSEYLLIDSYIGKKSFEVRHLNIYGWKKWRNIIRQIIEYGMPQARYKVRDQHEPVPFVRNVPNYTPQYFGRPDPKLCHLWCQMANIDDVSGLWFHYFMNVTATPINVSQNWDRLHTLMEGKLPGRITPNQRVLFWRDDLNM
jgi:hypothetical protein